MALGARGQPILFEHALSRRLQGQPKVADKSKATTEATGITKILTDFAEIKMTVKPEDLANLLPADQMGPALVVMADVRAYFQVAYKRFVDVVPLAIDHELSLAVNGVDGERICRDFAGGSPEVETKRADLQKKLERLETASEELCDNRI
ncbi:hypothetical protein BJ912DRAFT_986412 [Pholiota molesta]|nr:hypothetical protein BJ912DRAFT_986412 [Pholiota molesta]